MLHHTDKKICLILSFGGQIITYNGLSFGILTTDERNDMIRCPFQYEHILIKSDSKTKDDMVVEHKNYIHSMYDVLKLSDGVINMYRTGTVANTALCLFNTFNDNKQLNVIKEHEFKFLENGGGVRVASKGYEGAGYKYDINSYYPSLMCSKTLKFPISEGRVIDITTEEAVRQRFVKFGVYHAIIECNDARVFTTIGSNMYSHTEINYAKQLKLKINIIGQCIVWDDNQLIAFYSVFDKFVKYLYSKKKQNKFIKLILNSLWGGLVQKRGGIYTYKIKYDDINLKQKIIRTAPIDNTYCMLTTKRDISFFKTTYARINPFLLGMARVSMHKTFNKIKYDNILWSHTDSIVSLIPLTYHLKLNTNMGNWKYEGYSKNLKIYNKNVCSGQFDI